MEPRSEAQDVSEAAPGAASETRTRTPSPWRRFGFRCLKWCALAVLGYLAATEVGMRIPVNGGADPDQGEVDVYVVSNGVHASIWLPTTRPERDWAAWLPPEVPARRGGYVDFGWGDRGFYLEVPTWDDLTLGVALRGALWPTPSAVRATAHPGPPLPGDRVFRVRLGPGAYGDLVRHVEESFQLDDDGRPVLLRAPGYGPSDRFFAGRGSYHLLRTCNTWTNGALKAAGQRAALWTPFERGVLHHLRAGRGQPGAGD